ncbi:hypothetical protein ASF27_16580 [Methylobacterium sp. Leaf102]|uniref:OB-fold-containig protein n=1 Tax=Methylobacterium sp. Leaf112 TaxID=1736258 RepID=UPI0006FD8ABF|nr:OB-fold-containig protein [Methylobacterium sp. Leaf112]KQP33148.1 hypothetical protein ASF27_16580 [Methylobacterium sp. Leaf102]KQP68817.1 hypothetical protein ASF52_16725 [Methylobacterium sp. Leaf112]
MMALTDPHLVPFTVVGGIMAGLVAVEAVALVIGHSVSGLVDQWFEIEGGHGLGAESHHLGSPTTWLSWINIGRVPFLILLIVALAAFTVFGFAIQAVSDAVLAPLPAALAAVAALGLTVPTLRASTRTIARLIPRDETYAVDEDHFVGRIAEVTLGPLDQGAPGQVRVRDGHGNSHSLRARAAPDRPAIPQGTHVLLVEHAGGVFVAVPAALDLTASH